MRRLIGLIWTPTFGGLQWRIAGWLSSVPFTTLHSSIARWTRLGLVASEVATKPGQLQVLVVLARLPAGDRPFTDPASQCNTSGSRPQRP